MNVQNLIDEGVALFKNKKFDEAIEKLNQALGEIEDENSQIQEQIKTQLWLGCCYLEQAKQAQGKESDQLFGHAVEHFRQQLSLAEQLEDKQNSLQGKTDAQSSLGRCYLEQAMQAQGKESDQLFGHAVEHFQQQLSLAEQLADKQNSLQGQTDAQTSLGSCYLIQAIQAKGETSVQLLEQAVKHYQQQLSLAETLKGKNSIQKQIDVQSLLGICYFKQAKQAEGEEVAKFEQYDKHCQQRLELSKKLSSVQDSWDKYFQCKQKKIQLDLFNTQEGDLIQAITTILAVLNIPPIELESIPLAHYTSPFVCEKLFGIGNYEEASLMRMGSSTYMNDPTEGEGLMELLNLQDLELENKADCPVDNAFFTCFSSRVNDLNQFRLYGKENGVEASGCCLVFNKKGGWLKNSNVSESFRRFTDKSDEAPETSAEVSELLAVNLPLYQVAYIAYKDEYIAEEKCRIWLPNKDKPKFGIRLKSFGNKGWHECRIGKLEEALIELMEKSNNISDEDKKALEYIRYLFKDFAFRDEEEFRLLKIEQIGSDKIEYCNTTQSIYLPYANVSNIVDEVILGTNYEKSGKERKAEVFQHLMRKHYPNVKVSRSSLPINANPPIKKD